MKYLSLAAAALVMTIGASASSFNETCSSVAGGNGATSFAPGQLTCNQFSALPGGNILVSVTLQLSDSFNQGVPGQTNGFDFSYTNINPDVTLLNASFPTNSCVTTGIGIATTCEDQVTGNIANGNFYQLGNLITTNLPNYLGSGIFNVAVVSGSIDNSINSFSALNASGQLGSTAFAVFTYTPQSSNTPEPASTLLIGGGLLAFSLIGRKKFARK